VSFITTVIIWQDNELVNNVIPFAGCVRVASGAPSGDNSDVVVGGQLSAGDAKSTCFEVYVSNTYIVEFSALCRAPFLNYRVVESNFRYFLSAPALVMRARGSTGYISASRDDAKIIILDRSGRNYSVASWKIGRACVSRDATAKGRLPDLTSDMCRLLSYRSLNGLVRNHRLDGDKDRKWRRDEEGRSSMIEVKVGKMYQSALKCSTIRNDGRHNGMFYLDYERKFVKLDETVCRKANASVMTTLPLGYCLSNLILFCELVCAIEADSLPFDVSQDLKGSIISLQDLVQRPSRSFEYY
ncbi:hypothetical protein ALC53_00565, partial [Atta colombica]